MQAIADDFVLPSSRVCEDGPMPSPIANKCARVEEEEDEDIRSPGPGLRFSEQYPHSIAQLIRFEKTRFEKESEKDSTAGEQPWKPFASKEEWELATWLINNVNQTATDKHLKLPIVS